MNRLKFSIDILADKTKIWDALWADEFYRAWVGIFSEGSYAVTDNWKEGSKVLFLIPGQNGIYSIIEKHIPNEVMLFSHVGNVAEGKEQVVNEETKSWSGAKEMYTLKSAAEGYTLTVEIDVMDEHLDFMKETFPKALEIVKDNAQH